MNHLTSKEIVGLVKIFTQSAADFLDQWFESEELKVTLANGDVRFYYLDTDYYVPIKIEDQRMIRGAVQEFETTQNASRREQQLARTRDEEGRTQVLLHRRQLVCRLAGARPCTKP